MADNGPTALWIGNLEKEVFVLNVDTRRILRVSPDSFEPGFDAVRPFQRVILTDSHPSATPDLMRPEHETASSIAHTDAKPSTRAARSALKEFVPPQDRPPLWVSGPSVPYSRMTGDLPSTAVLEVSKDSYLYRNPRDGLLHWNFPWGRTRHSIPLSDELTSLMGEFDEETKLSTKQMKEVLGYRPSFLLCALRLPTDGYCRKTVVALLP